MLGSESIEEMFDRPDWSEDDMLDDDGENANSESLLEGEKNPQYSSNNGSPKNAEGDENRRFLEIIVVLLIV